MKYIFISIIALFAGITAANCQNKNNNECSGGWTKYENNPVLGGNLGTLFDVCVLKDESGKWFMYSSWYDGFGIGLSESKDGLNWTNPERCVRSMAYMNEKGNDYESWDKYINRPVVLVKDGIYHLWFSGQDEKQSCIGYATSTDGKTWKKLGQPVLAPQPQTWEKNSVMNPHVIWDSQEQLFKMWYSAGTSEEAEAIGYATSKDGIKWTRYANNPVFTANKKNAWEQAKVSGCQVIKRSTDYLMFYRGYANGQLSQIGMARSKDGITGWERYPQNPIIKTGQGSAWDLDGVYKPYVVADPAHNRWLLYYNGRKGWDEQIGVAVHKGMDLGL